MVSTARNNHSTDYLDETITTYTDHSQSHEFFDALDDTTALNYAHNEYIGTPPPTKTRDIYRIFGCNPNGFTLDEKGGDFAEYCEEIHDLEADSWGIFETKLDTTNAKCKETLFNTIQQHFEHSRLVFSSSVIPSPRRSFYKPGGTLLATGGHVTGRVVSQGSDKLGRWSYQVLSGRGQKSITIISAYQVCAQPIVDPTNNRIRSFTASAQQISLLRQAGRDITPRAAFVEDLNKFIENRQAQQSEVLVMGDFNEALNDSMTGMSKLQSDRGLIDLMFQLTGMTEFGTHVSGHERIDYVLCTPGIAQAALTGCYEPFKKRGRGGDHRNIVIDFDVVQLFGNETPNLGPISSREFTSKDRSTNRQYMESKHDFLRRHNFGLRLQSLKDNWDQDLAERLDKDFQRAGKYAAKRCTKKPRSIPFSRELADLRVQKNTLLKVISSIRLNRNFDAGLMHTTRHGHSFLIPDTLQDCQTQLRAVQRRITEITKTAVFRRQNELKLALEEAKKSGDTKTSKAIKHRMAAERTKAMYDKLRKCRGTTKNGITRLDVPAEDNDQDYAACTEWITIDTPSEIETKLLQRNQRHFGQAQNTYPTIPPFSEWVDWGASSHTSELILEGSWAPPEIDELSQSMINHMKSRVNLDSVPGGLTKDEWIGKIKAWPESTTTSPSGFHLGHSKVLLAPTDLEPQSTEFEALEEKRADLIDWQVGLLNVALVNGYCYERWKHIVNVMILKEPGNLKIHRLRVIHLYEQDYNLVLATKWRKMISNCSNQQVLNPSQFGGVPGKDAVIPTFIEEMQYEISRASKRPLVHMDYDATACYDRIVMNFGSLASRAFGQHRSITFINARNLAEAKYYLKTKLGVSERFYKHCQIFPIYGSGQGAGNSPAIWCVISCVLFDVYEEKAYGATFESPCRKFKTQLYMIGFVDDTSGNTNDFALPAQAPLDTYISKATHDAQRWNDTLSLSGGALNLEKCTYHFMHYTFSIDGLPNLQHGQCGPDVTIHLHGTDQPQKLRQLSSYACHKTLGVQKSPKCTDSELYAALDKKNKAHIRTMANSPFTRTDSWAYYHSIYLPSMTYPFPSSTLSDSNCQSLQRPFKQVFLPRCGFNRNTPNAVVYGPTEYGGLALRDLSVEKSISQIYLFLACVRSQGVASELALIAVSWGQFLAGISKPILQHVDIRLPHMEPMVWIPQVRSFLASIKCTVELTTTFVPPLQRQGDSFLMDHAISLDFNDTELCLVNACRLYLGVTLMSDIVTVDGKYLSLFAIDCSRDTHSRAKGLLPYQTNPSRKAWTIWKRLLLSFTVSGSLKRLHRPLGAWLVTGLDTYRQWNEYLDPTNYSLYVQIDDQFERFVYQRPYFVTTASLVNMLPSTCLPAQSVHQNGRRTLLPVSPATITPPEAPAIDLSSHISKLEDWESQLLRGFDILCSLNTLQHELFQTNLQLLLCSDGSAAQFRGTFGCVGCTLQGLRLFRLNGPAPGYRTSSFRSESYGCLSILRFLFRLFEFYSQSLPDSVTVYTDSKSLVQTINKRLEWSYDFTYSTMNPDWDIQQSISSTVRQFPQVPSFRHVKGHQDNNVAPSTLSLPAQLNVEADNLASSYVYPPSISSRIAPLIGGATAILHGPFGTINSNYRSILRTLASAPTLRNYLRNKHDWSSDVFNSIDWESHGIAVRSNFSRRHFVVKFLHQWLPLGHLKARYATYYSDECPSCPQPTHEDMTIFFDVPTGLGLAHYLMIFENFGTIITFTRPSALSSPSISTPGSLPLSHLPYPQHLLTSPFNALNSTLA